MSCIHFKFKCDKKFDSVVFDGASCTLAELKKLIIQKKGLSKHAMDFDLLINNAQTKQVYSKPNDVIQRNSSVIVARIPAGGTHSPIDSAVEEEKPLTLSKLLEETAPEELARIERNNGRLPMNRTAVSSNNDFWIKKACEQTTASNGCAPEEDELTALSTLHLRESNAMNTGRRNQFLNNAVPHSSYVCHRCHRTGHFKHVCPLLLENDQSGQSSNIQPVVKRATGIPRSELIPLKTHFPGAYITSEGTYAIPRKDAEAIINADKRRPSWDSTVDSNFGPSCTGDRLNSGRETTPPPPAELTCSLCKDLFIDAVMTPCCHENFCDSCIRNRLLESDENECPSCHQKDIPLDQVFANKFLRDTVARYGRKKTATVSELFDKKEEPDLDQALTTGCMARSSAGNNAHSSTNDVFSGGQPQGNVANNMRNSAELGNASQTDKSDHLINGDRVRFNGCNSVGTSCYDSISDAMTSFAVPAVACSAYDQSATLAAIAAAAAAFLIPPVPFDTLSTSAAAAIAATSGIADVVSSSVVGQQSAGLNGLGGGTQAAAVMAALAARATQYLQPRNDYFGQDSVAGPQVLTREQFETLKEMVAKLKAAQNGTQQPSSNRENSDLPGTEEDKPESSSKQSSPPRPADGCAADERQDHQPVPRPNPVACGDRSSPRKDERHHRHHRHSERRRHNAEAREEERSRSKSGRSVRPSGRKSRADKRKADDGGRQADAVNGHRSSPEPHRPRSANGNHSSEHFTLNVLEFAADSLAGSSKVRKLSQHDKGKELAHSTSPTSRRHSNSAERRNGEQDFVLKPRLLSHVQSVKDSSPASHVVQSTPAAAAEQWVEKLAIAAAAKKAKKSKHKKSSSKKREKKRKHRHHSSVDAKKHKAVGSTKKHHAKKSPSSKKRSVVPVAV